MIGRCSTLFALLALLSLQGISAEDAAADAAPAEDRFNRADADDEDPTKTGVLRMMKLLTIANSATVLDERTFTVKDAKTKVLNTIRLGNVAPIEQGSLSPDQYQEKVEAGKAALQVLVGPMFLWKAAADEHQPKDADENIGHYIIADVWTTNGKHVPASLTQEGHLVAAKDYESEWSVDILQAATGKEKQDAYAKLDEALRESNAEKAEAAKAAQKAEEAAEPAEPIGFGGWIGLLVLVALVVGVFTNFGQPDKKKKNPNRKPSSMEKVWKKIKGQ